MALLSCPECGGKVSDKALSCPHCGAPVIKELPFSVYYDGEQMDASGVLAAMYNGESDVKHRIWDMCDEAGIPEDDLTIGGFIDQIYDLYEKKYGQKPTPIELVIPPSEASLRQTEFENRVYSEKVIVRDKQYISNTPRCPTCQATNLTKIGVGGRIIDGLVFGGFSVEGRAQFRCNSCGYMW